MRYPYHGEPDRAIVQLRPTGKACHISLIAAIDLLVERRDAETRHYGQSLQAPLTYWVSAMESSTTVPRLALVVNLGDELRAESDVASARHLDDLFDGHRLPATWVVRQAEQTRVFSKQQTAAPTREFALSVDPTWSAPTVSSQRFRRDLRRRLSALAGFCGEQIIAALGDAGQLRARASILAGEGIGAVISARTDSAAPRPLACGLWSLPTSVALPAARRLWGILPPRHRSVKRLVDSDQGPTVIVIDAAQLGGRHTRSVKALDTMLRDISWAASRGQLNVITIRQIVLELAQQNQVKPQRSILRVAA